MDPCNGCAMLWLSKLCDYEWVIAELRQMRCIGVMASGR